MDYPHKIQVLPQDAQVIPRPRLIAEMGTIVERRLISLVAPIGYGKTTLLIDFANAAPLPVAWYSLDPLDQNPWTFLVYLTASIARCFPEGVLQTRALLSGECTEFVQASTMLVREVRALTEEFIIIIDDWHLVDAIPEINQLVGMFLLHCPNCHVILATGNDLQLPNLLHMCEQQQARIFAEDHLCFTPAEVTVLIALLCRTLVLPEQTAPLVAAMDGWITGIAIAIKALAAELPVCEACSSCTVRQREFGATLPVVVPQRDSPGPAIPDASNGWIVAATQALTPATAPDACVACMQRQIYRLLHEQVLACQPPALQTFLLETALLEEMTPAACTALQGRADAEELLALLLRRHLFVRETAAGTLRYNPLFRAFLLDYYRRTDPLRYQATARQVALAAAKLPQSRPEVDGVSQPVPAHAGKPVIIVRTLGYEQLQVDDRGIEIGWRKAREVLYYLLHHRNGVPPDTLCEAIWPELPARRGRDTLWTAIHLLRKHLPAGCIVFHGRKLYRFNRDIVLLDYDVEQFLQLLSTNNSFEAHGMALDLYQGSYLPWSDTPWTVSIRTDMEQRYLQTLRLVAASYEQRNAYEEALNLYRRMLELDPLDEATHARVMNCQIILGNRAAAVEQYGRLRHVLDEELGLDLDPASEAERLYCDLLTPA